MKPLIGITSEFRPNALKALGVDAHFLLESYTRAIAVAGGLPVVLPIADATSCIETLSRLDGLLLTGDARDVPPDVLGQPLHEKTTPVVMQRWDSDVRWLTAARELGIPVLGICFGMQLLNVALGGSVMQHIPDARPDADLHITDDLRLDHEVNIEADTLLASMAPSAAVTVRSTHHQAVEEIAPGFKLVARATDGIPEAIEDPHEAFLLGVQWHPELNERQPDWLLEGFVRHCAPGAPD